MNISLSRRLFCLLAALVISSSLFAAKPIRLLIVTGGHGYNADGFNQMLASFSPEIVYRVVEFPAAFTMFKPGNRKEYDVLVFYHMWQTISADQKEDLADCIRKGKPVVVLHHSICAFDNWPEYWNIIGGKYFHAKTTFKGKEYQPCTYIHDIHFKVTVVDTLNPVTKGITDFQIFDETYKGYYTAKDITPLLTTDEASSEEVIGWSKKYGKARIVVLQSGHDVPTYENPNFRKLLKQSIEWVSKN